MYPQEGGEQEGEGYEEDGDDFYIVEDEEGN